MQFDSHGLKGGLWKGRLTADAAPGSVGLFHLGVQIATADLTDQDDGWLVTVAVPGEVLSDGRHSLLLIADADQTGPGTRLARLDLIAGDVLDGDLAAEIEQLRAELELLKREFRRFASGG
ncbi:hypothetical protein [Paracoccus homiensis]|uniref:hypothetical protein n=1 Tax=Paracoccus homiensis TaxID=364199 RepID=UPI00398CE6F3